MNKILGLVAAVLVGLGFGYLVFHHAPTPAPQDNGMAGSTDLVENNSPHFINGLYLGSTDQTSFTGTGTLSSTASVQAATLQSRTIGSSSSSPAALGSAVAGFFTATTTTQSASSTAITANSTILLQTSSSTPFANLNVNCNAVAPTTTLVSQLIPGNGFIIRTFPAPTGTDSPYCMSYLIVN